MGLFGFFEDEDTKYERERLKRRKKSIENNKKRAEHQRDVLDRRRYRISDRLYSYVKGSFMEDYITMDAQFCIDDEGFQALKCDNMTPYQKYYCTVAEDKKTDDVFAFLLSASTRSYSGPIIKKNNDEARKVLPLCLSQQPEEPADGIKYVIGKEFARALAHLQVACYSSEVSLGKDVSDAIYSSNVAHKKVAEIDKLIAEIKEKTGKQ